MISNKAARTTATQIAPLVELESPVPFAVPFAVPVPLPTDAGAIVARLAPPRVPKSARARAAPAAWGARVSIKGPRPYINVSV